MDSYRQFKSWLIPVLAGLVITMGSWVFASQASEVGTLREAVLDQDKRLTKLETIVELQKTFNERLLQVIEERKRE